MTPLYNNSETLLQGHFAYRNDDDHEIVFEDLQGRTYAIDIDNLERVINFSNPDLPSEYYREKMCFFNKR